MHAYPNEAGDLMYPVGRASLATVVSDVHVNFANGAFRQTGGALDLAISGNGFFAVNAVNRVGEVQEMYTRNGSFTLNANRTLVTVGGEHVLGQGGSSITLPDGEIYINARGEIFVAGDHVDTIRIVSFEDLTTLRQHGYNMFTTIPTSVEIPFTGQVIHGYLEASNVNIIREMVDMINIARAFEINQRMVTIHDTTLGQAVSEIARR
jgi:flagellar basal-body rod protein FlgG